MTDIGEKIKKNSERLITDSPHKYHDPELETETEAMPPITYALFEEDTLIGLGETLREAIDNTGIEDLRDEFFNQREERIVSPHSPQVVKIKAEMPALFHEWDIDEWESWVEENI